MAVLVLGIVGLAAVGAGRGPDATPAAAAPDSSTRSVFDLQEGDCYETRTQAPQPGQTVPISSVEVVDCATPHTRQVVAKLTYSATDPFSGAQQRAEADCSKEIAAALSAADRGDGTLQPGFIVPADAVSWTRNPVAACTVSSATPISRSLVG